MLQPVKYPVCFESLTKSGFGAIQGCSKFVLSRWLWEIDLPKLFSTDSASSETLPANVIAGLQIKLRWLWSLA